MTSIRDGRAKQSCMRVVHSHDSLAQAAGDVEVSTVGNHAGSFIEQNARCGSSPGLARFVVDELGVVDVQPNKSRIVRTGRNLFACVALAALSTLASAQKSSRENAAFLSCWQQRFPVRSPAHFPIPQK